ncbi:tRNA (adenosine(37)-N6)-dimethylallyltransferase MiaA [Caenimonas terrae]|uniref:tRNA dimethylallyltransferase n=1 Tax=Caenimonas terrae TaxID=696074 RepID=A0ABW0NF20_9BURK
MPVAPPAPASGRIAAGAARVLALAGPTASGKSAAALAIARRQPCEIISVDSALVYRGMDIGTAKPSAAERAAVPHHLIDIRDPLQAYSAADFVADATALVAQINARGKLALLVGGTMLYFKALFEGLDAMPPADASVRDELEAEAAINGWPAMHAALSHVDPVTAARLAPNDAQRIQRALEVFRISGRPLSSFHVARQHKTGRGLAAPLLSLEPQERSWLHARIADRFDAMLAAGFLDEVMALRARGDLDPGLPSMRCVGYRQAWELLDAQAAQGGEFPLDELRQRGIFATRQLAKRQLTWLRGMPQRQVIACDAPDALQQVLDAAAQAQ